MPVVSSFDEVLERTNLTGRQFLIYAGQRLHPGVILYNSIYAIRWADLDPLRFKIAWQKLVNSCDALRIVIDEADGVPQQRVLPPFAAEVDCVDVPEDSESGGACREWIEERLQRPLILAERVFDTALIRTAEREYVWFLHVHHIVVDGAGVQILLRRFTDFYFEAAPSADSFPQFAPSAAAACAMRQSEEYGAARAYWTEQLRNTPETPHFYGVDASQSTTQKRVVVSLDSDSSTALSALARKLATPRMSEHAAAANLFSAVFAAYLCRVSGTSRVSLGVTFHNRVSEDDRRTVGLFMEVFPLTLSIEPQDSLIALLRQVATCTVNALKHRQFSIGHSARAPAFSGLFNYMRPLSKPLGPMDVRRIHPGHGSNAISLSVEPRGHIFDLWFDVSAEVAATSSDDRLVEHLRTLLVASIQAPDRPMSELPLLSSAETADLLKSAHGPELPASADNGSCLLEFERHAAASPGSVAVAFGSAELSYEALNHGANQLANKLRALGARRGRRVAICLERSPEMVIAVLAVLKAGAAYVPLDPAYPQARLGLMLADADPVVLVTTQRIGTLLPAHAARPLYIDQQPEQSAVEADTSRTAVSASDVAYVIYTSGSTGKPKGVEVTHANVSNHLAWRTSYFPLRPSDRCLQTASLSFDDSVWEILEPLRAGACVLLTRPRFEYDSAYLVQLMLEQAVTVACFVPSLLRGIIEQPGIASCSSLRRLTTGGEGLSLSLQRRVRAQLPHAAFYNGYGTTEATIASVYWKCADAPDQNSVPIGRPIANTQVYILDGNRQLVPAGVVGEICIGGAGVARGYLNRPEQTADRFVADPFSGIRGSKLYRTGDLGRLRTDGLFEFVGRADEQVKIRGIRVELGDIEAALQEHPNVRGAAVARGETPSGTRLTAYIVPRGSNPIPTAELRAFVGDRIPAAVIPNRFETVAALPMTPSGKLDRRALPAIPVTDEASNYVAPMTELESRLVSMWEEVLQARPISVRDDFFSIGGHSLLAVQLAAVIEKSVGRSLSPGLLFDAPTIELLASRLAAAPAPRGALVLLADGKPRAPLFLIHHVSGDITAYKDLAHYLGGQRPVYGVRVPELDSNEAPLDRVEAMASRYVRELRTVQACGPYLLGGHSAGAHIAFEMARQLREAGEGVDLLAILEADARTRGGARSLLDTARFQLDAVRNIPAKRRAAYVLRKIARLAGRFGGNDSTRQSDGTVGNQGKNAVWSAIERAVRQYRPQPYPGPVTLFRATDRRITGTYSRTCGWERLARGGIRVIDVPGTHSTVLRPGSEPPMAAKLRARLDELADTYSV